MNEKSKGRARLAPNRDKENMPCTLKRWVSMKPRNTEIRSQLLAGMVKKMSFMLRELDLPPEEVRTRDHATFLTVYSDPQTFFLVGLTIMGCVVTF